MWVDGAVGIFVKRPTADNLRESRGYQEKGDVMRWVKEDGDDDDRAAFPITYYSLLSLDWLGLEPNDP